MILSKLAELAQNPAATGPLAEAVVMMQGLHGELARRDIAAAAAVKAIVDSWAAGVATAQQVQEVAASIDAVFPCSQP